MLSSTRSRFGIGTIVALLLVAIPAQASTIVPGGSISPVDNAGGCACAVFLADTGELAWSIGPFHGVYRSAVVDRDPGAGVALEFLYQVGVAADSAVGFDIYRLIMSDFTGWTTDVRYYDSGGIAVVAPSSADRSLSGATVGFDFEPDIEPNTASEILAIRTTASSFTNGTLGIIGGAIDRTFVSAFQPTAAPAAVPEPASLLLLGTGVVAIRRRLARK